jgi:methionine synthase II (cobalamin-independent)
MEPRFKTPKEVKDYLMSRDKEPMQPHEKKIVDELLLIETVSQHLHDHFTEETIFRNFKEQDTMMQVLITARVAKFYKKNNPNFDPYQHKIPDFSKVLRDFMINLREEGIKAGHMDEEDFDEHLRCEHDQAIHMQIAQSMLLINQYFDGN